MIRHLLGTQAVALAVFDSGAEMRVLQSRLDVLTPLETIGTIIVSEISITGNSRSGPIVIKPAIVDRGRVAGEDATTVTRGAAPTGTVGSPFLTETTSTRIHAGQQRGRPSA